MSIPSVMVFGIDIVKFSIDLGNSYALFLVLSLTLNLEAGYSGVPNFGKVLFLAGGAVVAGSVSGRVAALILEVNTDPSYNGSIVRIISQVNTSLSNDTLLAIELLLLGVGLAAGIGAALGYLASFPAIRLREDYLGMLLLASAQFFQIFLKGYQPLIGGTQGLLVPNLFQWAGTEKGFRDLAILGVLAIFAALVYFYSERVARSPLGRTLRAIRDNEVASRALGKDDVAIRRKVIVIASAISGMAGALLTFQVGSVGPDTWTRIAWTFPPWVIIILGGAANNLGVALGALVYTFMLHFIDQTKFLYDQYIPFNVNVNWLEYLLFASLLISVLWVRPGGILPEKSSLTLPRKAVTAIMKPEPNRSKNTEGRLDSESISTGKENPSQADPDPPNPGIEERTD